MALRLRSQNERSSEANLLNLLGGDAVAGDMVYAIIAPHELVDQHGVETPVHLEQFAGSVRKYIYWSIEPSAPVGQASACPGLLHHTLPSPNAIAKRPVCGPPKMVGADTFFASCRGASPPKRVLLLE